MMRCERCGKDLTNKIIKVNGVTYCESCARLMGYDRFLKDPTDILSNPFAPLNEIASLMQMNELDFGNSALSCPKCGMSLREFERESRVGCIECYNTFNDYIVREMFKQQGNSEYAGRHPLRSADVDSESYEIPRKSVTRRARAEEGPEAEKIKDKPEQKEEESKTPADPVKPGKAGLTVDKLLKADLGMLSDEELENGIKVAAEAEEYMLASRLRDELRGRKDGGNNV